MADDMTREEKEEFYERLLEIDWGDIWDIPGAVEARIQKEREDFGKDQAANTQER